MTNFASLLSFSKCMTKKKDNDEPTLVVVFSMCRKTKQKKMMTSAGLSLSSLGANKQNRKRQRQASASCHLF
jgi:hypothetical protein